MYAVSTQCNHGDVRLVNGSVPNEGRVEVCVSSIWGTVCDMGWGSGDAKVVCRQVGYTPDGKILLYVLIKCIILEDNIGMFLFILYIEQVLHP